MPGAGARGAFERSHEDGATAEILTTCFTEEGHDLAYIKVVGVHAVDARFPFSDALGHAAEVLLESAAKLFLDGFPFEGAEAGDLVGKLVVPIVESGFGDGELGGDGAEACAAGTELEESGPDFSGVGFHGVRG